MGPGLWEGRGEVTCGDRWRSTKPEAGEGVGGGACTVRSAAWLGRKFCRIAAADAHLNRVSSVQPFLGARGVRAGISGGQCVTLDMPLYRSGPQLNQRSRRHLSVLSGSRGHTQQGGDVLGALPGLSRGRRLLRRLTGYGDHVYRYHVVPSLGESASLRPSVARVTALRFSGSVTTVGRGSSEAAGGALSPGTGWGPRLAGSRSVPGRLRDPSKMAGQDYPHAELCPRLDSPHGLGLEC